MVNFKKFLKESNHARDRLKDPKNAFAVYKQLKALHWALHVHMNISPNTDMVQIEMANSLILMNELKGKN